MRTRVLIGMVVLLTCVWAFVQMAELSRQAFRAVIPDVTVLSRRYPVPAVGPDGAVQITFNRGRPPHWRALSQIAPVAISAVLLSEDSGFYQHKGYEPEAMKAAWIANHKPGVKVVRGGSTITQQLVKNVFLSREKTLIRKARELILALQVEHQFSKRHILELYLNVAEWGPGVFGIQKASEYYFGKSAANLSAREAAILAHLLPSPVRYGRLVKSGRMTEFAERRVRALLQKLWRTGRIDESELGISLFRDSLSL
jgi:monofunctional biosynthetic peptidoglycan transglycosylase